MEFKIEKIERVTEMPEIANGVMYTIHEEAIKTITNCHDELMMTMLEHYGIDRYDLSKENLQRVTIVTTGFNSSEHVYVDGYYAFTIEGIPQVITEWEKESTFRAEAGYVVRVYDDKKGERIR